MTRITKENKTTEARSSQRRFLRRREKIIETLSPQSKAAGEGKSGTTKITKTTKQRKEMTQAFSKPFVSFVLFVVKIFSQFTFSLSPFKNLCVLHPFGCPKRVCASVVRMGFIFILLAGCAGNAGSATPTAVPTPVVSENPTYTVQRGTVTEVVQLTGRVLPSRQQDLAFVTAGYVQDVFFKQGDAVKAGDLIARLDGLERYAADIADAQLALDQANYDLVTLKQNAPVKTAQAYVAVTQAKAALDAAQAKRDALNYARVSDPLVLKKLQQDRDEASKALDAARQAYAADPNDPARLNALIAAQDAFNQAQDSLSWALGKPTQADIDQAEADLALAKANYQVALAEWNLWQSGMDASELHLAESKVADAQARLTLAQKDQETIELRAPFDGQILSIGIAPGSQVTAFTVVATVADPSILEISAIPTPQDLDQLGVGQAATVKLSSHPNQTYPAHVSHVPLTGATTQDQSIIITLDGTGLALTLGEAAGVTVQVDQHQDVLWLPPAALRTFQGQDSVLVEAGGVQRRVDVRLGLKSADRVEILEGLSEGQVVVGP